MTSTWSWVRASLHLLGPERCPGCDLDVDGEPGGGLCPACEPLLERPRSQRPPAQRAAAFVYCGPLADALQRLKYAQRAELARPLGWLLAGEARGYAGQIDRVLPVPLHPTRLRTRGFNQSALMASHVARALAVPLDTSSLRRVRATRDQAGLGRAERSANVEAAFACQRPAASGLRVLLVDDVETTGATLAAATGALLDAGFAHVRTLAMARAGDSRV